MTRTHSFVYNMLKSREHPWDKCTAFQGDYVEIKKCTKIQITNLFACTSNINLILISNNLTDKRDCGLGHQINNSGMSHFKLDFERLANKSRYTNSDYRGLLIDLFIYQ